MSAPKILAFAGSTRTGSFNKQLIKIAVAGATAAGAEVTLIDLRDFPMPLYDGDLEAASGVPEQGKRFKQLMRSHEGLLLSCPEYNSSMTGVFKNAIDWASRQEPGEAPLACFAGKVASLMSASPGGLGGLRGLVHVRAMLGNINVLVLPAQVAVPKAHEAFEADGRLKDPKQQAAVEQLGRSLAEMLSTLHSRGS
ncbi:MAG: NAD(P)H-dependent oxidoreductase [Candidatus Omnitrophica bacterium]|nr:NAD(P)H-dependent oxidoreductase [Candidatus Omnitrophota bacterium]